MSVQLQETQGVRLAIEGCGHGTLHAIYASVAEACKRKGWPDVDLLIICGDFQAVRNAYDLNCASIPAKYRQMGDFHEYYSGQRTVPYLTIFVGGNHEASNHLFELYYGGWVAPKIYYMGAANVLRFGPLRIAGLSGIWKGYSYRKSHYERLPYNAGDIKTVYDVRELDVRKLLQIRTQVDIGISHDWPNGIEWKGDAKQLFRFKPYFEEDAKSGKLGSIAALHVLQWLRPRLWFSAHLHCKFAAIFKHDEGKEEAGVSESVHSKNQGREESSGGSEESKTSSAELRNAEEIDLDLDDEVVGETLSATAAPTNGTSISNHDEIDLDMDDDEEPHLPEPKTIPKNEEKAPDPALEAARAALPDSFRKRAPPPPVETPAAITNKATDFLALDKCMPNKHFLQLMEVPSHSNEVVARPFQLQYDREWLAIIRTFALDDPLVLGDPEAHVPRAKNHADYAELIDKRREWVNEHISDADLVVPDNFEITAPVYDGGDWNERHYSRVEEVPNPQTGRFSKMLGIANSFDISKEEVESRLARGPRPDPAGDYGGGNKGRGGFGRGRGHGGGGRGGGNRGGGGFRGARRGRGGGSRGGRWN